MGAFTTLLSLALEASSNAPSKRNSQSSEPESTSTTPHRIISSFSRPQTPFRPHYHSADFQLQAPQYSGIISPSPPSAMRQEDVKERGDDSNGENTEDDEAEAFEQLQRYAHSQFDHEDVDNHTSAFTSPASDYHPKLSSPRFEFDLFAPQPLEPSVQSLERSKSPGARRTKGSVDSGYKYGTLREREYVRNLEMEDYGYPLSSAEREETSDAEYRSPSKHTLLANIAVAVTMARAQERRRGMRDKLSVGLDMYRGWKKRGKGNEGEAFCVPTL